MAEIRYRLARAGYWLRPYDMVADARRWRWQESECHRQRRILNLPQWGERK